jgi:hypothetical protein
MANKVIKKVSLKALLGDKEGKANADLYKDEPEKRQTHLKHRAPRHRMITPLGGQYTQSLSGDIEKDLKYYELAREFINNGLRQTKAYAAVFGCTLQAARGKAQTVFQSTWMRALCLRMLQGEDGDLAEVPKTYAIQRWIEQIETNVLDYIANDGTWLNVEELRSLPLFAQQQIRKLSLRNTITPMEQVLPDGEVRRFEVRDQHVMIELYDKQKALEHLAKAMGWIAAQQGDTNLMFISPDMMTQAYKRMRERSEDIEGQGVVTKITAD